MQTQLDRPQPNINTETQIWQVSKSFEELRARMSPKSRAAAEADALRLREDVAPVYDAMKADPGRAIAANKIFAAIRKRHAGRIRRAN